ncbi:MAG TPA: hypothetical protein VGJ95_02920 [Pseudonocardiaceae bacterium]|jgi:hypothetical protein
MVRDDGDNPRRGERSLWTTLRTVDNSTCAAKIAGTVGGGYISFNLGRH